MLRNVPDRAELGKYVVNREGWEAIKETRYDFQTYPMAGSTQLTFFALPVGQGGKTLSDTNMDLAGQMPTNQEFLVTSVEIHLYSSDLPSIIGAANAVNPMPNDAWEIYRSGNLNFVVGSKSYLQEAPLMKFPPKQHFEIDSAVAVSDTTAATVALNSISYGYAAGRPYLLAPANVLLTSNQNFSVTLNWPEGVVAIVDDATRIGVVLDGILYRRSQ